MPAVPLSVLLQSDDPAWPTLRQWLADASNGAVLTTTSRERGEQAVFALQASVQTTLGAIARYTAGVSVDQGWLRLLGAGDGQHPGLREWNGLGVGQVALPGALVVAHDVLGGFYAVNGGGLPGPTGETFYRSPRTLEWLSLGVGYTRFVQWALDADLEAFYVGLRWKGWSALTRALSPDEGFAFYPDLHVQPDTRGAHALDRRRRDRVPMRVLWELSLDGTPVAEA